MKYIFLSEKFYNDYADCSEIEKKRYRPYVMVIIQVDNLTFAIPLRSHIKHNYAYFTDKANKCGLDYSKAVVISNTLYINTSEQPKIRPNEYKELRGNDRAVIREFMNYLEDYKDAVKVKADRLHYKFRFCTLQYFHKELGLE